MSHENNGLSCRRQKLREIFTKNHARLLIKRCEGLVHQENIGFDANPTRHIHALAHAHGVELVPHQTQPTIGHMAALIVAAAQLHTTKPVEWNDPSTRTHAVFKEVPRPKQGLFHLSDRPGLGLELLEDELAKRRGNLRESTRLPPSARRMPSGHGAAYPMSDFRCR